MSPILTKIFSFWENLGDFLSFSYFFLIISVSAYDIPDILYYLYIVKYRTLPVCSDSLNVNSVPTVGSCWPTPLSIFVCNSIYSWKINYHFGVILCLTSWQLIFSKGLKIFWNYAQIKFIMLIVNETMRREPSLTPTGGWLLSQYRLCGIRDPRTFSVQNIYPPLKYLRFIFV